MECISKGAYFQRSVFRKERVAYLKRNVFPKECITKGAYYQRNVFPKERISKGANFQKSVFLKEHIYNFTKERKETHSEGAYIRTKQRSV